MDENLFRKTKVPGADSAPMWSHPCSVIVREEIEGSMGCIPVVVWTWLTAKSSGSLMKIRESYGIMESDSDEEADREHSNFFWAFPQKGQSGVGQITICMIHVTCLNIIT